MGMYTGLRVKVTVKQTYREMIKQINEGASWNEFTKEFPFLNNYAKQHRANFIPRGAIAYIDQWETGKYPNTIATDGFERYINMDTGYWIFQCSLKNYNQEIQEFLKEVLPEIIESSDHIEYRYEECDESVFYKYSNGQIIEDK